MLNHTLIFSNFPIRSICNPPYLSSFLISSQPITSKEIASSISMSAISLIILINVSFFNGIFSKQKSISIVLLFSIPYKEDKYNPPFKIKLFLNLEIANRVRNAS